MSTRLLFVDDEASIRLTLPLILKSAGFDVSVAASVAEALELIQRQEFDVLLSDLNIGDPADGLILVSAMRRIQPKAATFILTGYPDLDSAIESIRRQVDDYFIKPMNPGKLVASIQSRLLVPRQFRVQVSKSVAALLADKEGDVMLSWMRKVNADEKLSAIAMSEQARIDHLPQLIQTLAECLQKNSGDLSPQAEQQAREYGSSRAQLGYTASLLVAECRLLTAAIAEVLEQNLLNIDISTLIPGVLRIGQDLHAVLEIALEKFGSRAAAAM